MYSQFAIAASVEHMKLMNFSAPSTFYAFFGMHIASTNRFVPSFGT